MGSNVAIVSGLLPPAPDGIGTYAGHLAATLGSDVAVIHLPASQGFVDWYRAVRRARTPILHVQYPSWGASWRQALVPFILKAAAPRSVVVTTFHEWAGMRRLMRWSAVPLLLVSRRLIAVSRAVQAQLTDSPLCRRRRVGVDYIPMTSLMEVPSRTALSGTSERRAEMRLGGWSRVVTHFGFVYASKQPDRLLEALALLNAGGARCRLVFVGGFFEHRPERERSFRDRVEELGLTDAVVLTGFIHDPVEAAELIAASDGAIALYEDGASVRRTSLWYLTQLGVPIITTGPTLPNEFEGTSIDLAEGRFRVLRRDATPGELAEAIRSLSLDASEPWPPLEPPSWSSIADAHRVLYAGLAAGTA